MIFDEEGVYFGFSGLVHEAGLDNLGWHDYPSWHSCNISLYNFMISLDTSLSIYSEMPIYNGLRLTKEIIYFSMVILTLYTG